MMKTFRIIVTLIVLLITGCENHKYSTSLNRFRTKYKSSWVNKIPNKADLEFVFSDVSGIGYQDSVIRRDPSDIIKVGETYYLWYTRSSTGGPLSLGPSKATDELRAYPWDLAEIWLATSVDGKNWNEVGVAVKRGDKGSYDARSVFTPNILRANGKFYLYYQTSADLTDPDVGDFKWTKIGMSWSNTPLGPWNKCETPMLTPGKYGNPGNYPKGPIIEKGEWDALVCHDPSVIKFNNKYFLYYKSRYFRGSHDRFEHGDLRNWVEKEGGIPIGWGVATSDLPEGPFVKSELNPVIIGGHECIVWPYKNGICAMLAEGPEMNSIQYSKDGLNFTPIKTVKQVPIAAGMFRPDMSDEPNEKEILNWGIYHVVTATKWHYLKRFELNDDIEQ